MGYQIVNSDFFKKKTDDTAKESDQPAGQRTLKASPENDKGKEMSKAEPLRLGDSVIETVSGYSKALKEAGFPSIAAEVEKVYKNAVHERFTIAVVGEFSRGKSTFINKLLNKDFLPVGILPTTAVITRIRYSSKEVVAAFDESNRKSFERPLSEDCWEDLVAHNFNGQDFKGTVLAGVNSRWLHSGNIELIDTPGAGDLNESRVKSVGDALLGCDGAIITVSAASPLSLSEKLFIEERLIARKMPFMLLIITMLDRVPYEERAGIIRYIKDKLKGWNMDIPVFVPYSIEAGESDFDDIIGMDKIRKQIADWINNPERVYLTEEWVLSKTSDLVRNAIFSLREQQKLLEAADEKKRAEMIEEKKNQLLKAETTWGELKLQMQLKCTECYVMLVNKVDEYSNSITERLQYEASHAVNPKKWWTEDFQYRAKVELTNMSAGIENIVSRHISEDARWYCTAIERTFNSYVLFQKETISDKELFGSFNVGGRLEFEDLDRKRNAFKIGSTVLSISGFALFSAMGFLPIVATMGIGTGTAIFSEHIFKKKIEKQREELKNEIARCIPAFIRNSMEESENRLKAVYDNIIKEAEKSEKVWLDTQYSAIEAVKVTDNKNQYNEICNRIMRLKQQLANDI